jgi:hypothetical protein
MADDQKSLIDRMKELQVTSKPWSVKGHNLYGKEGESLLDGVYHEYRGWFTDCKDAKLAGEAPQLLERLTYLADHMLLLAQELEDESVRLVEQAESSPDNQPLTRDRLSYQAGLCAGRAMRIRARLTEALQ